MEPEERNYLVLLRRELIRAQARLKRAQRERDEASAEDRKLRERLRRRGLRPAKPLSPRARSRSSR